MSPVIGQVALVYAEFVTSSVTNPIVGQVALGVYAALLAVGGLMGYLKAKSKPSLIAGLASAAVAVALLAWSFQTTSLPFSLGIALAVVLVAVFGRRYAKTRKFMPSGLLIVLSIIVGVVLAGCVLAGRA